VAMDKLLSRCLGHRTCRVDFGAGDGVTGVVKCQTLACRPNKLPLQPVQQHNLAVVVVQTMVLRTVLDTAAAAAAAALVLKTTKTCHAAQLQCHKSRTSNNAASVRALKLPPPSLHPRHRVHPTHGLLPPRRLAATQQATRSSWKKTWRLTCSSKLR